MDSPRDESTTEENLVMVLMNSIVIYFVYIWDENLIEISVPKMGDGMG